MFSGSWDLLLFALSKGAMDTSAAVPGDEALRVEWRIMVLIVLIL